MLATQLDEFGIQLRNTDKYGIPSQAKEAMAFALLAYETWHRRPGNVPSATGAHRSAVLGKISYV
jgi:anhydro-N-acetylmuramic acid kinase